MVGVIEIARRNRRVRRRDSRLNRKRELREGLSSYGTTIESESPRVSSSQVGTLTVVSLSSGVGTLADVSVVTGVVSIRLAGGIVE